MAKRRNIDRDGRAALTEDVIIRLQVAPNSYHMQLFNGSPEHVAILMRCLSDKGAVNLAKALQDRPSLVA